MHRRALILAGAAAMGSCASPGPPAPTPIAAGGAPPTPPSTPPPPPPPLPPENPAFLARPSPPLTSTGDARFDRWRDQLLVAWGEGWRPYLLRLFAGLRPITVQPEPWTGVDNLPVFFVRQVVTPDRITEGRRRVAEPWLQAIAAEQRVPAEVLAAVWGAETDFGRRRGEYDLLAFWATRAAVGDGMREDQFGNVAKLVVDGRIPRSELRAFGDGSTGMVRWFPTQVADMAVDYDADGVADIWRSPRDALGSVATRLGRGWAPGSWVVPVVLPTGDDPATRRFLEALRRESSVRADYLRRVDGRPWAAEDINGGRLLQPLGAAGPAFLLLRNFAPLQYLSGDYRGRFAAEARSQAWGLAVGLLANAIRGELSTSPL